MAAGIATLRGLMASDYAALEKRTLAFASEMAEILRAKGQNVTLNHLASIFTLFFTSTPVTDYETAKTSNSATYGEFYRQMRQLGVNLAPSGFECGFTSFAHSDADLQKTLDAARQVKL
jgi:glutamate-1-semialdehyde 2,1-aminomutase